jgi:hypothetical protein
MKQWAERLCSIVIGCANKAKLYSPMSKITIGDNYSEYNWREYIQTKIWREYI